ncbi:hypothetical protein L218DRAFT_248177 [Marasmius fiardii PR-910]|nr:hypothetical protein L218DRAFT_248177 [Marasmius fiardii PR-910]
MSFGIEGLCRLFHVFISPMTDFTANPASRFARADVLNDTSYYTRRKTSPRARMIVYFSPVHSLGLHLPFLREPRAINKQSGTLLPGEQRTDHITHYRSYEDLVGMRFGLRSVVGLFIIRRVDGVWRWRCTSANGTTSPPLADSNINVLGC